MSGRESGIALVVTLILLSVVTFLAVAFLFLATRERDAVVTVKDMAVSRRQAEAANENARAQISASLISSNQFWYRMIVSTNYGNADGFKSQAPGTLPLLTNVNYEYKADRSAISIDDRNQNIANLYYASRPPVFVRTNRNGKGEFRFYLDLNQNGRFDTNGLMPELGNRGIPLRTLDTNGNVIPVTNFFVGDPEWVGMLERPDRPHSPSNKFVGRWCFIVVPSGKTLDVNTLHNQAKHTVTPLAIADDGFSRNMGVAPYEMNLASFLVDLNTNVWNFNPGGLGSLPTAFVNPTRYRYDTNGPPMIPSEGTAFLDAVALTRYRYGGDWRNLKSVSGLFGAVGGRAFELNGSDDYGSGPLLLTNTTPTIDGDFTYSRVSKSWPGAENPHHFFTTQDLLDGNKTRGTLPSSFSDRLFYAGYYGNSSYDRYTFYRLLSQLGTDSPPDPELANKIHLNYINVDTNGSVVPDMQTNFFTWTDPLQFFTNAADRLLRATFSDPKYNVTNFNVASGLSLTNIPVWVSNKFVYTPSVHRILQLTANIWDSTTNRVLGHRASFPYLPTVFRPTFRTAANEFNPAIKDIYINGFVEVVRVSGSRDAQLSSPLDLSDPNDLRTALSPASGQVLNIYGVPWVIGAKKGFPNFNEFAMQTISQMTRKLQLRRASTSSGPFATNQMYILGVSNTFAFEAWNSYQSNYSRDVQVIVANDMSLSLTYTNDPGLDGRSGFLPRPGSPLYGRVIYSTNVLDIPANAWQGSGPRSIPVSASFKVPLQTNIVLLPDSIYRTESNPYFTTNSNDGVSLWFGFEQTKKFPIPEFNVSVSNRVRFIMLDKDTGRVVDYVQLGGMNGVRELTQEAADTRVANVEPGTGINEAIFWRTNRLLGSTLFCCPEGVNSQILASKGEINVADWNQFGINQASLAAKDKAIDAFRVFLGLSPLKYANTVNTNLTTEAPFTPTRKSSLYVSWQANDPLVHYTAGDLAYLNLGSGLVAEKPNGPIAPIANIGRLNDRFEPWGGNPSSSDAGKSKTPVGGLDLYSLKGKDPGIKRSDNWDFPTNKFGTVGLLGRVHRGSPWQTVYLKADDIDVFSWAKWTGNSNFNDAIMSRPVMDRALLDVFTTAIDKDSTRGQLNVNQTGLAAWSALLGGVIGLTNSSSEDELLANPPFVRFDPVVIDPAGTDPLGPTNSILGKIHDAADRTRAAAPFNGSFKHLGDILAVPELSTASPLLNTNGSSTFPLLRLQGSLNDAVYERLPQQLLGLMRGGDQPSFTIYAYGQALHPANRSIITSGPYSGLCTNYQITAEFATRTVVRIEGAPDHPKAVIDSFNVLPP